MSDFIIKAENLGFCYENSPTASLKALNFDIKQGEIILLTGDSGSGKSTLLNCLNGLIPNLIDGELSGSLYWGEQSYTDLPLEELSRQIGTVFQNPRSQFFTTNTTSELVFPMENYGYQREEMQSYLEKATGEFALTPLLDRDIFTLSSGERQLLALASAKILNQKVLLFDEPSANLDYGHAMALQKLLLRMQKQGVTSIVSEHRSFYLQGILNRVFLMKNGHLQIFDSETAFLNSPYRSREQEILEPSDPITREAMRGDRIARIQSISYQEILSNVCFDCYKQEIVAIVGKNGVGKTTLARLLIKTLKPTGGDIVYPDLPYYVMQDADYQLFGTSVWEELKLLPRVVSDEERTAVLKQLNLSDFKYSHPFNLSDGQKQRLQIATACLSGKDFLIFDEPTSGLDRTNMQLVAQRLNALKNQASILIISHDIEFIRLIADRIIYLKDRSVSQDFLLTADNSRQLTAIFKEIAAETKSFSE